MAYIPSVFICLSSPCELWVHNFRYCRVLFTDRGVRGGPGSARERPSPQAPSETLNQLLRRR